MLTEAIVKCLTYEGKYDPASPPVAAIIMPQLNQARAIHWEPVVNLLENQPWVESVNRSDFRVRFKAKNKPDLLIRGSDNHGQRLRGLNLIWVGFDEVASADSDVWDTILMPSLARNADYSALLISTPLGKNNHWYKLYQRAQNTRDHAAWTFYSKDNPFFPLQTLRDAKLVLPPKTYDQEHRSSFLSFDAQWFASLNDHHITLVLPLQFREVFMGVDWGDRNAFLSVVGVTQGLPSYYLIDAWEPVQGVITTEPELIKEAIRLCRQYGIRRVFAPDDRPALVESFRRAGRAQHVDGMARAVQVDRNKPGITERNLIADSLFYQDRFFINAKLEKVADDFRSYHKDKDKDGLIINKPAKGQRDHSVNATLYCVSTLEFRHHPTGQIPHNPISEADMAVFNALHRAAA